jgi:hypothetical protein
MNLAHFKDTQPRFHYPVKLHNLASQPWIQHPPLDVAVVDALPKRTGNAHHERESLKSNAIDSELMNSPLSGATDARLGKASALSQVQAFVKDVKLVSLVVASTGI